MADSCGDSEAVRASRGGLRMRSRTRAVANGSSSELSGGDAAHAVDELDAAHLLQHVAGRAGHDRVEQRFVVVERRQHETSQRREHRSEIAADLDPAAVGQADIEHGDVGRRCRRPLDRFGSRAGLADDLEIVGSLQQVAHASPDHLVVVDEEHPDHDRTCARQVGVIIIAATLAAAGRSLRWCPTVSSSPVRSSCCGCSTR